MRVPTEELASAGVRHAAAHLGRLIRDARIARRMPRKELAARAKTSMQTLIRMESGGSATSLGTWLSVMEQVGLLPSIGAIRDTRTEQLLALRQPKRAVRRRERDLDF